MASPLTIGHIAYANCEPFFHYLRECGFTGTIRAGVPAELNRYLAEGKVDLSPSSSFEYLRNWRDYQVLPGLSISSLGAVKSVLLFSPRPVEQLREEEILLTGESASSIHLLHVLLREYFGFAEVTCRVPTGSLEEYIHQGAPALLIGDRALRLARTVPAEHVYDLGELWYRFTGLPFVFALWILRQPVAEQHPAAVAAFYRQLLDSTRKALEELPELAREVSGYAWYGEQNLVEYWESVSYGLDEGHLAGLHLYAQLLVKYGFLAELPAVKFFGGEDQGPGGKFSR